MNRKNSMVFAILVLLLGVIYYYYDGIRKRMNGMERLKQLQQYNIEMKRLQESFSDSLQTKDNKEKNNPGFEPTSGK